MKRILKWVVPVDDRDHPIGAGRVVLVACQGKAGVVTVWTEEDDLTTTMIRRAQVYGTGQEVPDADGWLGSTITEGGWLVWHVFGGPAQRRNG